ncbi:MAG: 3-hydroxyacyl-CoA dehydrogenase family protein [Myxococcales bacterium]
MKVERIAVLGAGTMGHGIAQIAAQSGYTVRLYDIDEAAVSRGLGRIRDNLAKGIEKKKVTEAQRDETLARISTSTELRVAEGCELVIEAGPEDLALKQKLFAELSTLCGPDAVLATNTSSLSLTDIAAAAKNPARVVGMHFFNPPHLMKLLEIVRAFQTSDETVAIAREVGTKLGKELVQVNDAPGFASSRLGIAIAMEAIRMVEEGVARPEDIDRAMELGYNHPMGPLKLTDHVGLDVRMAIAEYLHRELGAPQFRPPQRLKKLVKAGKLGKKSGEGFYKY